MATTASSSLMTTQVSARVTDELDRALETYRLQHEYPPDEAEVIRVALRQYLDGGLAGGDVAAPDGPRDDQVTAALDDSLTAALDEFIETQAFPPSRSEVIRRALAEFLSSELDQPLPA